MITELVKQTCKNNNLSYRAFAKELTAQFAKTTRGTIGVSVVGMWATGKSAPNWFELFYLATAPDTPDWLREFARRGMEIILPVNNIPTCN